jgi:hypothetical protein
MLTAREYLAQLAAYLRAALGIKAAVRRPAAPAPAGAVKPDAVTPAPAVKVVRAPGQLRSDATLTVHWINASDLDFAQAEPQFLILTPWSPAAEVRVLQGWIRVDKIMNDLTSARVVRGNEAFESMRAAVVRSEFAGSLISVQDVPAHAREVTFAPIAVHAGRWVFSHNRVTQATFEAKAGAALEYTIVFNPHLATAPAPHAENSPMLGQSGATGGGAPGGAYRGDGGPQRTPGDTEGWTGPGAAPGATQADAQGNPVPVQTDFGVRKSGGGVIRVDDR